MKKFRKIASLLLVLVMALALGTAAFADVTTGTITVANPQTGETYTAYKIFDVKYNGDAYSYTMASNSEWLSVVQAYAQTANNGLTLTKAVDGSYIVSFDDSKFSAPAFAAVLKANESDKTGITLDSQSDGTVKKTGLALGYYFVTSSNGALCNLTTTNPTVTIYDKNDIPFDKVDDKESVDVGETVNYTITGKVPDTTGFKTYTYCINDEMSDGLTFSGKNSVSVKIDGTDVTSVCTITVDSTNGNKFSVTIPVMNYQDKVGKEITVTYTAVVNEKAVAQIENNKATLAYSNDPTDSSKTATTPEDIETVYSAKIVIDKYVSGSNATKLAGAKFVLYKQVESGETTKTLYYKWNETSKKVEWTETKADATVKTTDVSGAASFDGVADGTYYLEEIEAPLGYNMLEEAVKVEVKGPAVAGRKTENTSENLAKLTVTAKVANETGTILPATGGVGTKLFYAFGALLVLGAGVLLVTKKRMNKGEN